MLKGEGFNISSLLASIRLTKHIIHTHLLTQEFLFAILSHI